jgi:hypothetical protein
MAPSAPPDVDYVPRTGSRWFRITLLALIPILIVAGGGAYLLTHQPKKDTRQADAEASLRAYLSAWDKADYPRMAARANASAAAISAVDAPMRKSLGVTTARFTPGALTRDKSGDRGTAPYTAQLGLSDLGTWTYSGTLTLVKSTVKDPDGHLLWQVQFSSAAIMPRLAPGRTLERTRVAAQRGQLLDADGIPLRGADTDLDSNLLGTVGPLTAEQAKELGPPFRAGDVAGQTGIERVYNPQLAGRPGGDIVLMKGSTKLATLFQFPAIPGHDVKTTIDLQIQRAGEAALAGQGLPAALVAIDTRTGGVTGIVNHPAGGYGRAIRGKYPPGSTFKVVTATAALLAGQTENTPVNCPKTLNVSGFTIKNAEDEAYGPINLKQALAVSCNTAFVNIRESITEADMERAAQLYGFNAPAPLPIQSFGGSYPKPSGPVDVATSAFGQAAVEASPLQMASVAAAVASGTWRQPFVAGRTSVTHPIPANVDAQLKDMMRAVVTSGTAAPVTFPGLVYGKTGTAEYGSTPPLASHAWFIGWRDSVAFAVIVEGGGFGASVAAPVASRFLAQLGPS